MILPPRTSLPSRDHTTPLTPPSDEHPTVKHSIAKDAPANSHRIPLPAHALSSAVGSSLANLAIYPFSLISTRLKTQTQINAQRRLLRRRQKSLQTTTTTTTTGEPLASTSEPTDKLTVTDETKTAGGVTYRKFFEKRAQSSSTRVGFTSDSSSSDTHYDGIFDAAHQIYAADGITGFYAGVGWDTLNSVANGLWYFAVYNMLRQQRMKILHTTSPQAKTLPILEELGIGILSQAAAKLVSHPLSTIVARKQTAKMLHPHATPPSILDIYHDISRESGVAGLWSGYSAELLLTLNPSLAFFLYETVKPHITAHRKMDKLDTFLLAAACKAVATTSLYPLQIARVRRQLEGTARELELDELQQQRNGKNSKHRIYHDTDRSVIQLVFDIWEKEGAHALFVGLKGTLFKELLSQAVTGYLKQAVHTQVIAMYMRVLKEYRIQTGEVHTSSASTAHNSHATNTPAASVASSRKNPAPAPHHLGQPHTKTNLAHVPIVPQSHALPKTVASVDKWMDRVVDETKVLEGVSMENVVQVQGMQAARRVGREPSVLSSGRTSLLVHPGSMRDGREVSQEWTRWGGVSGREGK